jgi:hypothetical protein
MLLWLCVGDCESSAQIWQSCAGVRARVCIYVCVALCLMISSARTLRASVSISQMDECLCGRCVRIRYYDHQLSEPLGRSVL